MPRQIGLFFIVAFIAATSIPAVATAEDASGLERARSARLSGNCSEAQNILSAEIFAHPDDADLLLEKSLCETAAGNYGAARRSLERALELAPDYSDLTLALARLDYFEGHYRPAEHRLSALDETPEVAELKTRIREVATQEHAQNLRADLSAGKSFLSKNLPDWDFALASLSARTSARTTLYASAEYNKRFGMEDIYYEAGWANSVGERLSGYVSLGGTPDADYRPEIRLSSGLEGWIVKPKESSGGTYATLNASFSDYAAGSVSTIIPALYYVTHGDTARLGVKYVYVIDETGKTRTGEMFDARFNVSASARFGLTAGRAPENSDGQTLTVSSLSAWAGWRITPESEIRGAVVREERTAYDLTGVTLSLSKAF